MIGLNRSGFRFCLYSVYKKFSRFKSKLILVRSVGTRLKRVEYQVIIKFGKQQNKIKQTRIRHAEIRKHINTLLYFSSLQIPTIIEAAKLLFIKFKISVTSITYHRTIQKLM